MSGNGNGAVNHWFGIAARRTARAAGSPLTFIVAVLIIVVWAIVGPYYEYSDTWQLIINTGTTIVTFLMVFLIQNTQNRDSDAIQLKLDELIRALHGAENTLIDLEDMDVEELERLRTQYAEFADKARNAQEQECDRTSAETKPRRERKPAARKTRRSSK
jgi:low affinity Fe/Cu permease